MIKNLNLFIIFLSLTIINCSTTKYKLPENYVDEPPILPAKMYESRMIFNKDMYDEENVFEDEIPSKRFLNKSIWTLSTLLMVRKSISDNWEMPMFPIPINMTYLFGENDFKKHNRIGYNKIYHVIFIVFFIFFIIFRRLSFINSINYSLIAWIIFGGMEIFYITITSKKELKII